MGIHNQRRLTAAVLAALALPASALAQQVTIDGKIDPAEWAGAEHVTDFRLTEPLTGAPSPYPTEAWILATPEGLAIAFRNTQPASVPRTRSRTQRDGDAPVDRVNLMIDYDGDGRSGYNFTLNLTDGIQDATITNERSFSKDWDASWQHAVSEDGDTWSAEMLIPWYVAPMKKPHDGKRTVGIYLDRVVGSTGERMYGGTAEERARAIALLESYAAERKAVSGLLPLMLLQMGDGAKALEIAREKVPGDDSDLLVYLFSPVGAKARTLPEFQAFVKQRRLEEAWAKYGPPDLAK